jgi:nuclear pore complex protein Nup188
MFQEALCMQFWDKDSYVDGPIRSVLHIVEKDYPFHIKDLLRFLSAVSYGTWPAQCVYVFVFLLLLIYSFYILPHIPDMNFSILPIFALLISFSAYLFL